jgi:hypothetical protein
MYQLASKLGVAAIIATTALTMLSVVGCAAESESPETCTTNFDYFAESVMQPVLTQKCLGCHMEDGFAAKSRFILREAHEPGSLEANFEILEEMATLDHDGQPLMLVKATNTINHGGGHAIEYMSNEFVALSTMLERFQSPPDCDGE